MPELPEVETVRRGLSAHLTGKRIMHVAVRRRDLRLPLPQHMEKRLEGRTLIRIDRRAKYLLFHFDDAQVLLAHLGMSGSFVLKETPPAHYRAHDHVIIEWSDGTLLVFHDPRRFGLMTLTDQESLAAHTLLSGLGPEPLSRAWNAKSLHDSLRGVRAPVKTAIMDQRRVVGVGNIYACEALFRARIHPARRAHRVTPKEAVILATAIKNVLQEAIASGGSTLRDYVRSSGDSGYFQHHFSVYGRQNLPCTACKKPVLAIRQSGRSTFFCPHCQRR